MEANDLMKVRIERAPDKPPATCITYPVGEGVEQWHPDPEQTEFEVDPVIAQFAVDSGLFRVAAGSRLKLRQHVGSARSQESATDEGVSDADS